MCHILRSVKKEFSAITFRKIISAISFTNIGDLDSKKSLV